MHFTTLRAFSIASIFLVLVIVIALYVQLPSYNFPEDGNLKQLRSNYSPPPSLSNVMNPHLNVGNVGDDPYDPYVFEATVLENPDEGLQEILNMNASENNVVLYLYAQGLFRKTRVEGMSVEVDVAGCMVGNIEYNVVYENLGTYACVIPSIPRIGDALTLTVNESIFKTKLTGDAKLSESIQKSIQKTKLPNARYLLRTTVSWNGQLDPPKTSTEGKYEKCLMTLEKLFPDIVVPWVEYHRRLGFDKIYIYDNRSPVNLTMYLHGRDYVEVVEWPWPRSQYLAQNHFLLQARRRCHWTALMDVDEYIALRPRGTWKKPRRSQKGLLSMAINYAAARSVSQMVLGSITMGSSGNVMRPCKPPAEAYVHVRPDSVNTTKPLIFTQHSKPATQVHTIDMRKGADRFTFRLDENRTAEGESMGLIHFAHRSWEEHVRKGQGDRSSFNTGNWEYAANWRVHKPSTKHLKTRDEDLFVHFREIWYRVMNLTIEPPVILKDFSRRITPIESERFFIPEV